MEYRAKLIGVATLLLCVATVSQALTLGRIRGAALVGQPLSMVVPVQVSSGDDASLNCFEAEVFHADARQDPSRVKLAVEPGAQSDAVNVRILSSLAVDEPVVTVVLRTLCNSKTTRRYVLLADFPSAVDAVSAPIRSPSLPLSQAPAASPAPAFSSAPDASPDLAASTVAIAPVPDTAVKAETAAKAAKAPTPAKPKVVKKTVKKPVQVAAAPKPAPKPVVPAPGPTPAPPVLAAAPVPPTGQPRLTLDAPLLLSEQADVLAPAPGLSAEVLKIQTLESDVKALLALAAKNEASLLDLRTRLQAAESERLPGWMVYALGALLLACLVVIALLLRRPRQGPPGDNNHWSASVAAVPLDPNPVNSVNTNPDTKRVTLPGVLDASVPPAKAQPVAAPPAFRLGGESNDGPATQVDVSLLEMSESNFDNLMQTGMAHSAVRKSPAPKPVAAPVGMAGEPHNLNSSTAFDVRQQAEFFVSLGQTDQAVRILEKYISDSDDPNPHVYLDLLAIFHALSLKVDFRQFREDFNLLFNSRVAEFAAFKNEGRGLEAYPSALEAISAVWPTDRALGVIEGFVFRDSLEPANAPFDLAALRDLLLLHAVAQRIVVASSGAAPAQPAAGALAASPAKPYFADSGLGLPVPLPIPMPSPHATAADVDVDVDVDLDLDFGIATPEVGLDLDLSLPLSEPMDLPAPGTSAPAHGNLIDFDISAPVLPPQSDDKTAS